MLRATSLVTIAALALAANGQSCQGNAASCLDGNDSVILRCNGGAWTTANCPANQGCMTMGPGMIHCMLRSDPTPTAAASGDASAASPAATSAAESSMDMSDMHKEESSGAAKSSAANSSATKSNSTNGAVSMKVAAALGFAVAGVAAMF
ncbi:hypothetical protein DL89DRAFT_265906 [Linderina pennispora]|uniref:Carbohydrate-binding module family 19 domain-containing protein n=1 Tax=Linderina pennispora TaxID=61395 RepID=A0A1Y1WGF8_9FUNG|nr:uncharacterized protein DL89DRAFT_265906 [Linderina pennispora]ORX72316.1 hypothetical protein DL89DRAFT_265906 [Linderina pennispora]